MILLGYLKSQTLKLFKIKVLSQKPNNNITFFIIVKLDNNKKVVE